MMTPFSAVSDSDRVVKSFILKLCWLGMIPLSPCHAARVPLPSKRRDEFQSGDCRPAFVRSVVSLARRNCMASGAATIYRAFA